MSSRWVVCQVSKGQAVSVVQSTPRIATARSPIFVSHQVLYEHLHVLVGGVSGNSIPYWMQERPVLRLECMLIAFPLTSNESDRFCTIGEGTVSLLMLHF